MIHATPYSRLCWDDTVDSLEDIVAQQAAWLSARAKGEATAGQHTSPFYLYMAHDAAKRLDPMVDFARGWCKQAQTDYRH